MTKNTSSAVMAQRTEPHDSLDDFPTPKWATRALCEWIKRVYDNSDPFESAMGSCWEPACGKGYMASTLAEYFVTVHATDIHAYGYGGVDDFLFPRKPPYCGFNWIITNPPFRLAEEFALTAFAQKPTTGVALFVRTAFLESVGRYARLFQRQKPIILQFTERVPLIKGRVSKEATSATAYCWLVWPMQELLLDSLFAWIEPCRKRLERAEDYA